MFDQNGKDHVLIHCLRTMHAIYVRFSVLSVVMYENASKYSFHLCYYYFFFLHNKSDIIYFHIFKQNTCYDVNEFYV